MSAPPQSRSFKRSVLYAGQRRRLASWDGFRERGGDVPRRLLGHRPWDLRPQRLQYAHAIHLPWSSRRRVCLGNVHVRFVLVLEHEACKQQQTNLERAICFADTHIHRQWRCDVHASPADVGSTQTDYIARDGCMDKVDWYLNVDSRR